MEFNQTSGASSPIDLIPNGTLAWAKINYKGMKLSPTTGSRYAEIELTISDQHPFARRKIFTKIGDPQHPDNSQGYKDMGMVSLTRMLEAAGLVDTKNGESYIPYTDKNTESIMALLDGKFAAIRVKVDQGTQGYEDKNEVAEYLTPNERSQSHKKYLKLLNGDFNLPAQGKPGRGGFGGQQAKPAQGQLGFNQAAPQQSSPPVGPTPEPKPQEPRGFNPNAAPSFLKAGQS